MVKEVSSAAEFDAELSAAGSKLVVVDFHAVCKCLPPPLMDRAYGSACLHFSLLLCAGCGPCKVIAPVFQRLALQVRYSWHGHSDHL